MENGGGEEAAAEVNVGPSKRTRRPSVRLHQPYYENPDHRKLPRQWKGVKKDFEGPKKPRTVKNVHVKKNKNGGVSDSSKGELEGLNLDDDAAIGNWKNFGAANRDRDFKRKRVVRPSSSKKWVSVKSPENEDLETEKSPMYSGGDSEKQEGEKEGEDVQDEDLGANGINSNLVAENSDPSCPNSSFGNDDGNEKMSDDNVNVRGNPGTKQRGLRNGWYSNETNGEVRNREEENDKDMDGVREWLDQLGLGKYAPLFEVHEVDDEVLPLLTLEDLKDMGITAVGARRKMYSSIQKLGKGFS